MKFVALSFLVFLSCSVGQAAPLEDFLPYESRFLEIVRDIYDQGPVREYPFWARWVQWEDWKFHPPGHSHILEGPCTPEAVKKSLLQMPLETEPSEVVRLLDVCSVAANLGIRDPLRNVVFSFLFKLKPLEHPLARHVFLHLPNGLTLKGFLALKGDGKKRPLVLLRTGIFSSARDFFGERGIFMQLFDSSPFNVLLVESLTGWDFVRRDSHLGFAGFDEGLQNFLIARELQKPSEPLSKIVESVHMAGVSMGGHGTLFASVLNELNPWPRAGVGAGVGVGASVGTSASPGVGLKSAAKVFSSFTAFCPLIQFQATFRSHLDDLVGGYFLNYWAGKALGALKDRYPGLRSEQLIPDFISYLENHYKGPMVGKVDVRLPEDFERALAEFSGASANESLFWQLNDVVPRVRDVKTPFLLLATKKDRVVPFALNAGMLNERSFPNSNLAWYVFDDGYHCSTTVVYDWAFMSALFEGHILRNSGYRLAEGGSQLLIRREQLPEWVAGPPWRFKKLRLELLADEGLLKARLSFSREGTLWARTKRLEVQMPLSQFQIPKRETLMASDMGRAILRRWFYQNLMFKVEAEGLKVHWNEY